jgi:hypothetical protein
MKRSQLHAAVAHATGESLGTIKRIGFCDAADHRHDHSESSDPLKVVDCPCCGGTIVLTWSRFDKLPEFAECRRCETIVDYHPWEIYTMRLESIETPRARSYVPAA